MKIAVLFAVAIAMFVLSGFTATAHAAEYKTCLHYPYVYANGVHCHDDVIQLDYATLHDFGSESVLNFITPEKTVSISKLCLSGREIYAYDTALTNGKYAYYTLRKDDLVNDIHQNKLYKINLSTEKSTLVKSLPLSGVLKGVYGTKIYYLTDYYNGKLKVYDTSDKTTRTILKDATEVEIASGRYIYVFDNTRQIYRGIDTHTGKIVVSPLKWDPATMKCVGLAGTKIVYETKTDDGRVTCVMDYNGKNSRVIGNFAESSLVGSYLYYNLTDQTNWTVKWYKTSISDGTTTKISEKTYLAKARPWIKVS